MPERVPSGAAFLSQNPENNFIFVYYFVDTRGHLRVLYLCWEIQRGSKLMPRTFIKLSVSDALRDQIQRDAAAAGVSTTEWLLTGRGYAPLERNKFPTGSANPNAKQVVCIACNHLFHPNNILNSTRGPLCRFCAEMDPIAL